MTADPAERAGGGYPCTIGSAVVLIVRASSSVAPRHIMVSTVTRPLGRVREGRDDIAVVGGGEEFASRGRFRRRCTTDLRISREHGVYDVVVVGGGHNGLVAAGYLAKAGLKVCVCEARDVVGGAAVSEKPFGPDFTVTSLSYAVSLLPPALVRELDLVRHGYHVYPQGPYFAPRSDGRYLRLPHDPALRREQIAKFSGKDADAYERWDAWMASLGRILGPLLDQIPPKIGSRRPADLLRQASLLRALKGVNVRSAVDISRVLTASIADLVEERFESDALRGVLSVSGVIGTWAGPRSAGTAYVMLHHHVGDLGDGQIGAWGFPRGGMGGVTQALAGAARSFGAEIRTSSPVARIDVRDGRATGVTLDGGDELRASTVITTAHPQISFLRLLDRRDLPADFVADIERWKTRSGTVKINLAVDRLPEFAARPGFDPEVHGGTIVLAESVDDIEGAFQDAAAGRAAALPFADICVPSVFDDSLAPAGKHVVSMFSQWVPHQWSGAGPLQGAGINTARAERRRAELDAYADRLIARMEAVAPGFTDSILHRQVIGPYDMEHTYGLIGGNIFHGELTLGQMFHARPAAGYADLRTPVRGLYQAGSATHGGGGVTGIPGRNVVRQVLADRRRARFRVGGN
jgi:phytoene dehydrogenase-like protein